ncbi:MAG: hypothetical protein DRN11_01100 [Thermoplasmata archaeon]|nr:MAG: hypothetical protein DRN11_01100 [Thermoplasmata archaeon]
MVKMPWGFGRGRGWGFGFGWYGYGWPGWGRGNPYPFCRRFPWLPRGWWRMPYMPYYGLPYYSWRWW